MDKELFIGEGFFVERLIELLDECTDRSCRLDIWDGINSILIQRVTPATSESEISSEGIQLSIFILIIIFLQGRIEILEKILREPRIGKILCIRDRERILIEALWIERGTLIVAIVVEHPWRIGYSSSEFPFFRIEIMCFIEKLTDLCDI